MNTKVFVSILIGVLVLGGSLGGAFIGGMAVGKSQPAEAADSVESGTLADSAPTDGERPQGQPDPQSLAELRQRFQSGQITQEEFAQLRQQFQGGRGGGLGANAGGGPRFGGGGLAGTLEKVHGNKVTVNTPQGPLEVTVTDATTILKLAEITLADLTQGMRVTVVGSRGDDGKVEATSIRVTPEGAEGFFGGGSFFGDRQRRVGGQAP